MSDPINSDTIINSSLSNTNDNVISEKVFTEKVHTDDVAKWSIVHFETDEEEDIEGFNDLIPSSWITTTGTLCWYPMNEHQATIHKLVKQCAIANSEWNCFSIKKIEENIEIYDRGMKMLVKISKNPNATLYSDIEEKGKGKRLKKPIKYFDEDLSDKENNFKTRRNVQSMLPPFPKLTNVSKSARASQPLLDKVDKMMKRSCIDKASSSLDNNEQRPISVAHEINVPHEISKNKHYVECEGVKHLKENSFPTEMRKSKSAAITSEGIRSCQEFPLSTKGCRISSKIHQKCAYTLEGEITLESLADAICYLNAEVLLCKSTLRKIDRNIESFLETETMAKKEKAAIENTSTAVHILDEFPLTNLEDLKKIERKLKKDKTFYSKVVDALHCGVMGLSLQKKVNSVLRMVLDDKLASLFNWKGQRGIKLKLSRCRIAKIMIEVVTKEFPNINETAFGRKAGPWLAQATFRLKKQINSTKNEAVDDNQMTSSNDENSESGDENKSLQ